ncbi:MAG: hypothetical protein PUP91_04435 [Rhizonema sp. PD37]|nr:hypothetical protein [Rhizonema sp. PD37]
MHHLFCLRSLIQNLQLFLVKKPTLLAIICKLLKARIIYLEKIGILDDRGKAEA